jgi:multidrug efflux pump subunit AcrA (membrane-fusion protein)
MPRECIMKLDDCTEFGLTLRAKPPAVVHGAALLLTALVAGVIFWAATTRVSLVVRAPGRVRAVSTPTKVSCLANPEVFSSSNGAIVREVHFHQGDTVVKGAVLVVLESQRLKDDIAKKQQTIEAGEEELRKLKQTFELMDSKHRVERRKAEADLAREKESIDVEKKKRDSDRKFAEIALRQAVEAEERAQRLASRGVLAREEWEKAHVKTREEMERLGKSKLPVPEDGLKALREAVKLVDERHLVEKHELELKCTTKQAQIDADKIELKKLQDQVPYAEMIATVDGIVITEEPKVRERIDPTKIVIEIAEQAGYDFEAEVTSEDRSRLSDNLDAKIKVDGIDFQQFGTLEGKIVKIAPDSEVRGPQPGHQRLTYPVRIRLTGDRLRHDDEVRKIELGMTGTADIVTGEETLLGVLVQRIRQAISLE